MLEYVITVGPSSRSLPVLMQLIEQGVTILRLNFSHGTHEWYTELFHDIALLKAQYPHVRVLADISGPSLRIKTPQEQTITCNQGDQLIIEQDNPEHCQLSLAEVTGQLHVGDHIIFGEGYGTAAITKAEGNRLELSCEGTFVVKHKMHLHTSAEIRTTSITEKDWQDLEFLLDKPIDIVAVSFIQDRQPIDTVRSYLAKHGKVYPIMSKIETQSAINNLTEIVQASDMVMVARGDLALEAEITELPENQLAIIEAGRAQNKPVIVATQMLFSMVKNPMPTRAEINDIALATRQGASGLMLSDETTVGDYPLKAVYFLKAISERAQENKKKAQSTVLAV